MKPNHSIHRTFEHTLWVAPLIVWLCTLTGCWKGSSEPFDLTRAVYVGSLSCLECHREQIEKHAGSHHALAMQNANDQTVLGDFNEAKLTHYGIESRMYRVGQNFMVETEGPDGQLHEYQVKFVFGVTPLQQYMVEFPDLKSQAGGTGLPRIQVLPICWDTKQQQWFYLQPPDVHQQLDSRDDLHWTGIAQRWNTMCAECHSTNFQKNFTPGQFLQLNEHSPNKVNQPDAGIGHYQSSFTEINVSCESCHGPASVHVQLASQRFPGWNRQRGYGLANLKQSAESQIQACAPCHARRSVVYPGFKAGDNYYDHYQESLLQWPVYYPDGQVLDEDYIHGSFLQSKMYHKGIRCTDCHDPHSATLKHTGNQVCTSCHQHPAAKYDSPAHHFHAVESPGSQCVNCHMPPTTYMQVDARHDHSLRIPRPDLSLKIDTPNACAACHLQLNNIDSEKRQQLKLYQDWLQAARDGDQQVKLEIERTNRWCDEACDRWYGDKRIKTDHWGLALHAGQQQRPDAADKLVGLLKMRGESAPAIVRATALQLLAQVAPQAAVNEALQLLNDPHPLVRASAAQITPAPNSALQMLPVLEQCLQDPVRSVRVAAAQQALQLQSNTFSPKTRGELDSALNELREGLLFNNDRGGTHLALGNIAEQLGQFQQAIVHYQRAIVVEPALAGARTNLAALLDRNLESAASLPDKIRQDLEDQVRQLRSQELFLLERDMRLLPEPPAALVYRYGLALYLDGQEQQAAEQLVRAAEIESNEAGYAEAAAMILEKLSQWPQALYWARQAVQRSSGSSSSQAILDRIRRQAE